MNDTQEIVNIRNKLIEMLDEFIDKIEEKYKQQCLELDYEESGDYVYSAQFNDRYKFMSGSAATEIAKKNDLPIRIDFSTKRVYFNPKSVIKIVLRDKPSKIYRNLFRLKDCVPELKKILEEIGLEDK